MKTLLSPLLLILLPIIVLAIILKFWTKKSQITILVKTSLGITFFALGLVALYFAMQLSMGAMIDNNIKCMTVSIVFIPVALLIYTIGIPVMLVSSKKTAKLNHKK